MRSVRGWASKRLYNTVWLSLTRWCKYRTVTIFSSQSLTTPSIDFVIFFSFSLLLIVGTISYTPNNTYVAAFHFTIALLPSGPSLITHPPTWYKPELVKTEKELEDEELKGLLARNLRPSKKKNKKAGEAESKSE